MATPLKLTPTCHNSTEAQIKALDQSLVVSLIICINYEGTYTGETECLHKHMNNTRSSIRHANTSSLLYTQHISTYRNLREPLFKDKLLQKLFIVPKI